MESIQTGEWKKLFTLDNAPFLVLTLVFILSILFFTPSIFLSFEFSKTIVISIGTLVALLLTVVVMLKRGLFSFIYGWTLIPLIILPVVYLISALLSDSVSASVMGFGYETGTFFAILTLTILLYITVLAYKSAKRISVIQGIFLIIAGLLALFHLGRFWFGPEFMSFGSFPSLLSNTIGKWYELSIFFGLSTIISVIALEMLKFKTLARALLYVILALSLLMLVITNFSITWYLVGIISLMLFVYFFSFSPGVSENFSQMEQTGDAQRPAGRKIAIKALIVAIISILFILPLGQDIGESFAQKIGLTNVEVRPSWSATYGIFKESMKENALLGAGPNRFSSEWQLHRPDVNITNFWNLNFEQGIGFLPTAMIETGFVGIVAWALFLIMLLFIGFKSLFARTADKVSRYLLVSTFSVAIFLWIINILYTPTLSLFALSFFFTGLFLAAAAREGFVKSGSVAIFRYPRVSFAVVMVSICILIATVGAGYFTFEKVWSSVYFQKAAYAASVEQNPNKSSELLFKALGISENDLYYRSLAELDIANLNNIIVSVSSQSQISDEVRDQFQNTLARAIQASRLAQQYDPTNFQNHVSVARVYETITPLGVTQAYETSRGAYEEAIKRSPKNPALHLSLARLEVAHGDLTKSEESLAKALELKPNYAEAIFFQSQLDITKGNLPAAIKAVEQIALISPNDPAIYFRLGLLKYDTKDFNGAISALEKAITLVPVYANAKYFLGLSYHQAGRVQDAIAQFENLEKDNPDNPEVKLILENLRAGKDPFANATDKKPEQRKSLPVEEKN